MNDGPPCQCPLYPMQNNINYNTLHEKKKRFNTSTKEGCGYYKEGMEECLVKGFERSI